MKKTLVVAFVLCGCANSPILEKEEAAPLYRLAQIRREAYDAIGRNDVSALLKAARSEREIAPQLTAFRAEEMTPALAIDGFTRDVMLSRAALTPSLSSADARRIAAERGNTVRGRTKGPLQATYGIGPKAIRRFTIAFEGQVSAMVMISSTSPQPLLLKAKWQASPGSCTDWMSRGVSFCTLRAATTEKMLVEVYNPSDNNTGFTLNTN